MGRSRVANNPVDDDATQKSKRRRANSSGENLENVISGVVTTDGGKPLYHCNYCNKDITGKVRIKCTRCPDFDLCVECFSMGVEITPHKSNHPYRVMDNLSFPLICSDWFADEEILLLEAIEMYGLGNWAEVTEHVGTKTKDQCVEHYSNTYLNSPCFPLPDMSQVAGKNRKELLAMTKGRDDTKKGFPLTGGLTPKEEPLFSPSTDKLEDGGRVLPGRSPSKKLADSQGNRTIGENKPKYVMEEGPSMTEFSSYNPKRHEFDREYDNDAERLLVEMEFKETDTETERELKLRVLHIYGSRLDERKQRKEFILKRNLLYPNPLEKDLTEDEREIFNRYKVFMRFLSQEDHDSLMLTAIEVHRLRKKIQELQEARLAGCRTKAEADAYLVQKNKGESELSTQRTKETGQIGSSKILQKANPPKGEHEENPINASDHKIKGGVDLGNSIDEWTITGLPGFDLLSEAEKQFCCGNRLLPCHYLKIQEVLVKEILGGSVLKKADARGLFNSKVDPQKVDKIYAIVLKKLDMQEESSVV